MSAGTKNKVALLLQPTELIKSFLIFQTIHIVKKEHFIETSTYALDKQEINTSFSKLPQSIKDALLLLSEKAIVQEWQAIQQKFTKQRSGKSIESFTQTAMLRYVHDCFSGLKPFFPALSFYHKILSENKKIIEHKLVVLAVLNLYFHLRLFNIKIYLVY